MRALWRPAWFELDQPLEVDFEDEYAFCNVYPPGVPSGFDLVFHNPLLDQSDPILRRARIARIHHAILGDVRRVETKGLVYAITLIDGTSIQVEAEETPGEIEYTPASHIAKIDNWDLDVEVSIASP